MNMRRIVDKEITFDYTTAQEMDKHHEEMQERGWVLVRTSEIAGDDKWRFTATYKTGLLYNGVNGR